MLAADHQRHDQRHLDDGDGDRQHQRAERLPTRWATTSAWCTAASTAPTSSSDRPLWPRRRPGGDPRSQPGRPARRGSERGWSRTRQAVLGRTAAPCGNPRRRLHTRPVRAMVPAWPGWHRGQMDRYTPRTSTATGRPRADRVRRRSPSTTQQDDRQARARRRTGDRDLGPARRRRRTSRTRAPPRAGARRRTLGDRAPHAVAVQLGEADAGVGAGDEARRRARTTGAAAPPGRPASASRSRTRRSISSRSREPSGRTADGLAVPADGGVDHDPGGRDGVEQVGERDHAVRPSGR